METFILEIVVSRPFFPPFTIVLAFLCAIYVLSWYSEIISSK